MAPLTFASKNNNLDMVELLLDNKAEVNVQNKVRLFALFRWAHVFEE
jgi:ankyrin repeat protein